ncbi:MFS transporter [Mycetocola reblochoni]|uniref:Major facilitator superfamily n=2 Tax=Mycetocola reblochoni TaxID=331618 RepID=A0A1R4K6A5_9MICO|nr:MFS transporter [Mycetocola reblochoni]RLP67993.1 MFS transporter [Mycetocola reblochoni]SJN39799.1 Major facilitator superfamily [Mycetocola reblochoni REB411]
MNSRRSWVVYGVAVVVYVVAVLQRSSLGVAGVDALDRFGVTAAAMSSLAVMQLVVYAGMQIPVGVLIDRFGPRRLIIAGMLFLTVGQTILALSPHFSLAVTGRVLVGAGDATIFVSVMRLTTSWFSGPIVPQLSQWIGNLGQIGQILSAVPFAWLLHMSGWTTAFLSAASLAGIALVLAIVLVHDRPRSAPRPPAAPSWGATLTEVRGSFARPGTQLGFWSHFSTQSSGTVFSLLWGYPFMVFGLGWEPSRAAAMLLFVVLTGVVAGPVLGLLSARFPYRRSNLVIAVVCAILGTWALVLAWPGTPPDWLVIVLLLVLGVGGPGSLISFDFARTANPPHILGAANGVVNVGGFLASFVMMFLVGAVLDLASGGSGVYGLDAFRVAFLVQFPVIGTGLLMVMLTRRRSRATLRESEGIDVGPLWVALMERWRGR